MSVDRAESLWLHAREEARADVQRRLVAGASLADLHVLIVDGELRADGMLFAKALTRAEVVGEVEAIEHRLKVVARHMAERVMDSQRPANLATLPVMIVTRTETGGITCDAHVRIFVVGGRVRGAA